MPESRNRPGHKYQKPADIPARQRVKGRIIWAILFAIFGGLIIYFATTNRYVLIAGVVVAAVIGYVAGKSMEKDASHKQS